MRHGFLWFAALVSALGGFLFGYDWVVIGGAKPFYEAFFDLRQPTQQAWAMSCALVGCLLGASVSGALSEFAGRRRALLFGASAFALSALGTGMAHGFTSFVLWRIVGGIAIGLASALSPVYIAEISPADIRGRLVCLNELTIVVGILAAQTVNWMIARPIPAAASIDEIRNSWNGQIAWRDMFEAGFIPATVFLIGLLVIPESPRWLASQGQWEKAREVLVRLCGEQHAEEVLDEMKASRPTRLRTSISSKFKESRLRRILLVGVVLAVLQQWCGINVIFNYAQEIFTAAGYSLSSMFLNIVITGATMCLSTFVAIATVDKLGRRRLMILGCGLLALIYGALGALYFSHQHGVFLMVAVVSAIATYAMTLAPITWVVLSEIFPIEVRGAFMAICAAALWAACFVLTYSFPLLNAALGTASTFGVYSIVCTLGLVFVVQMLPETKRKSLEEIETLWESAENRRCADVIGPEENSA